MSQLGYYPNYGYGNARNVGNMGYAQRPRTKKSGKVGAIIFGVIVLIVILIILASIGGKNASDLDSAARTGTTGTSTVTKTGSWADNSNPTDYQTRAQGRYVVELVSRGIGEINTEWEESVSGGEEYTIKTSAGKIATGILDTYNVMKIAGVARYKWSPDRLLLIGSSADVLYFRV